MSKFKFSNDSGAEVSVDLSKMDLDCETMKILEKISEDNGPANLTLEQWQQIKDIKVGLGGIPGSQEFVVRFDWTWVKIDERTLNFDELTNPGNQLE